MRSSTIASQDHQRGVVRHRRGERGTLRLQPSRAPRGRARRMCHRQMERLEAIPTLPRDRQCEGLATRSASRFRGPWFRRSRSLGTRRSRTRSLSSPGPRKRRTGLRSATAFLRKSNFRGQSDVAQRPVLGHLARQSKIAFRRR
jgi:hypothetical protein